ncbi:MAG TPA: hypothetical protein VN735_04540, partial [Steroidobacteraceae bacterium]|nr:hypothetical protein [Steroidobacteraceae bacterium]
MSVIQPGLGLPNPHLGEGPSPQLSLRARGALLALVLFGEKFALNFFINTKRADTTVGVGAWVRLAQHIGFRFAVPFSLALTLFILVGREST